MIWIYLMLNNKFLIIRLFTYFDITKIDATLKICAD